MLYHLDASRYLFLCFIILPIHENKPVIINRCDSIIMEYLLDTAIRPASPTLRILCRYVHYSYLRHSRYAIITLFFITLPYVCITVSLHQCFLSLSSSWFHASFSSSLRFIDSYLLISFFEPWKSINNSRNPYFRRFFYMIYCRILQIRWNVGYYTQEFPKSSKIAPFRSKVMYSTLWNVILHI